MSLCWVSWCRLLAIKFYNIGLAPLFFTLTKTRDFEPPKYGKQQQEILKGEVPLYHWPPDWLVWISLFCNKNKNYQLSYSRFQTSRTGGQQYSNTSPCSIPCQQLFISPIRLTRLEPQLTFWSTLVDDAAAATGSDEMGCIGGGTSTTGSSPSSPLAAPEINSENCKTRLVFLELLTNIVRTSYKLLTNFLQTSYKLLTNFLRA